MKNHYAKIVYLDGRTSEFSPLSERAAKRIYNEAVRDMAFLAIKRTEYGLIGHHGAPALGQRAPLMEYRS